MKSPASIIVALLAACGSSGSGQSTATAFGTSAGGSPPILRVTFAPNGTPYILTSIGVLKLEGDLFVPLTVPPPAEANNYQFVVESDGTMYAGSFRLKPGASEWEELVGAGDQDIVVASDHSLYSIATGGVDTLGRPLGQISHWVGDGPWTPVGPQVVLPQKLYPDARGGVWFESDVLTVARGDTLTRVRRSSDLGAVGADSTLYYFFGSQGDDFTTTDASTYGAVLSINEAGTERMITRGTCYDARFHCPHRDDGKPGHLLGIQLAADGSFYQIWNRAPNDNGLDPVMVMQLSPGDVSWHPVADVTDKANDVTAGPLVLWVGPDGSIWTTVFDQIGGVGSDGSVLNIGYGYIFRIDR